MLADERDVVIGVDTHRDQHALAIVDGRTGAVLDELTIAASPAGYRHALEAAEARGAGRRIWAIEGTGAYGAGLCRHLEAHGEQVAEIDRPARPVARGRQKSDALDARRAARTLIMREHPTIPRADGGREALRVLMLSRESAVQTRTIALQQMRALIVSAPDALRGRLGGLGRGALIARCRALRAGAYADPARGALAHALCALARRAHRAGEEADQHERAMLAHVRSLAPALLFEPGVGTITAAQLIISFSHPGRMRSEAAFARLGGVAPIPASSGQVVRHRLDRGGDRQLNRALHVIVLMRRAHHPPTRAYIQRRVGQGKSTREAVRCLKRYVARHLFRLLEAAPMAA